MYENWYVMQVRTEQEQVIADKCQSLISKDILEECVALHYEHMKKYQGRKSFISWLSVYGYK